LVELQREVFPPRLQLENPEEYYTERLSATANINLLMAGPEGGLTGCMLAIPHSLAFRELKKWDPELKDDPGRMYVEMVQIRPGRRQGEGFLRLIIAMCEEIRKRGYTGVSMHVRTATGLSRFLQRVMVVSRCLRRLENWHDFGEAFDYLETGTRTIRDP